MVKFGRGDCIETQIKLLQMRLTGMGVGGLESCSTVDTPLPERGHFHCDTLPFKVSFLLKLTWKLL